MPARPAEEQGRFVPNARFSGRCLCNVGRACLRKDPTPRVEAVIAVLGSLFGEDNVALQSSLLCAMYPWPYLRVQHFVFQGRQIESVNKCA